MRAFQAEASHMVLKITLQTKVTEQICSPLQFSGLEWDRSYPTEKVYKVVVQKSIPPQIRQLIFYISEQETT